MAPLLACRAMLSPMRWVLALASVLVLAAPVSASAEGVDAGVLRGDVDPATGALTVSTSSGTRVLQEAEGVRAGFRTALGSLRATRAVGLRREGDALVAELATSSPDGRRMTLRVARDADGVLAVQVAVPGGDVRATSVGFAARPDERFLGFGERSNAVDQRGREVENFVGEGPFQPEERPFIAAFVPPQGFHPRDDATYFPVPWLLSTAGYGVLLDNDETSRFSLAQGGSGAWSVEADAASLALRVFGGPKPADVLERFTARLGRQPAVAAPWIFGAWWQPTPGGPEPVDELAAQRAADVPVSVTETFLHYLPCADHLPDRDAQRRQVDGLHARGTAALAYMNPMVCTTHPQYGEADRNGWFTKDTAGRSAQYQYSTADQFRVSQVDFGSEGGRSFFGRLLRDAVDDGFDGWMEDFGEYTPADGRSADGTAGDRLHNRYPTDYHRTATEQTAGVGRPIANYVRSGWTGTAAHARIVWGGDPTTDWGFDGLQSAVRNGLTMGLSGVSTWGSDIGGFFSLGRRRLTPELFKRWIQFGAVSGVMRAKSKGIALPEKERPQVETPDVLPVWRRYAKLRTQLLPYLQAADAEYQATGMPLMRSLALGWPDDPRLSGVEDAFLFGPSVLAAPVVAPGETSRRVELPPGEWVDLWRSAAQRSEDGALVLSGAPRVLDGGGAATVPAPLEELPLLVRAGAVLPLLAPDVDTLAPYGDDPATVGLDDRPARRLLAFPRGYAVSRMGGSAGAPAERVVSSEKRRRRWVLRVEGAASRRYELEAALGTLRRPFKPCRVRVGRRTLKRSRWSVRDGVLRVAFTGARVRVEVRGSCPKRRPR